MLRGTPLLRRLADLLAICIIVLAATACGSSAEPAANGFTPTAPADDVPDGVLMAREAVLEQLRDGVNECVPPKQASWNLDVVPNPPDGYDVYRFLSGGCAITITTTTETKEDQVYHVALGDGATGFCWQAVVDNRGRIILAGSEAQTDPTIGNPAKNYCEAQGFTFEMITLPSGQMCGKCTFDNGLSCNAWAFFHGACTPENAPTAVP